MFLYAKIALKMNKKNKLFQALIVCLLTGIIWILLFGSSVFAYKYRLIIPFEDVFKNNGLFATGTFFQHSKDGSNYFVVDSKEMINYLPGVKDVYGCYQISEPRVNNKVVSAWAYDDTIINQYTPKLKEGKWLSDSIDCKDSLLEAAIYCPTGNIGVGDEIVMTDPESKLEVSVKIIGILAEDALVYGTNLLANGNNTVQSLYVSPEELVTNGAFALQLNNNPLKPESKYIPNVLFFRNQELSENEYFVNPYDETYRFSRAMTGTATIIFNDDITDAQIDVIRERINTISDVLVITDISKKEEVSLNLLWRELYLLLPLGICIVGLMSIALVSYIVLNLVSNLRNYAVFFASGMKWKHCLSICFFQTLILHLISIAFFLISYLALRNTNWINMDNFKLNTLFLVLFIGVFIFDIVVSLIMPILVINKKEPKEMLYKQ